LDYLRRTALCGRVDEDLDLVVLFEPGEPPASSTYDPWGSSSFDQSV
jgi:hypothetical protein